MGRVPAAAEAAERNGADRGNCYAVGQAQRVAVTETPPGRCALPPVVMVRVPTSSARWETHRRWDCRWLPQARLGWTQPEVCAALAVGLGGPLLGRPGSPDFLLVFRAFRTGPARVVPRGVVAVGHGKLLLKTSANANVGRSQVSTTPHASTGGPARYPVRVAARSLSGD